MPVLAQCGYGRGEKVAKGIASRYVAGAILSPRDESRERLEAFCNELAAGREKASILFDPQFYAATLRTPRDGNLSDYPYYANNCGLSRNSFRPSQIEKYVKECVDYQLGSLPGLTRIVSPSIAFDDFRDFWSQIAIGMAEASVEYHATRGTDTPLLVSIIVSEAALRDLNRVNEFLDALSTLSVQGFYLLVQRSSGTLQNAMDTMPMVNLMYFVHVLGSINDYEVVVGYSDWLSLLLRAAGAHTTATGWHNGLRQFSLNRFLPQTGGRRPNKRYSSLPMLSCPLIVPELEDAFLAGFLPEVLTGGEYDPLLSDGPANGEGRWTDEIACLAHWQSMAGLLSPMDRIASVPDRLDAAARTIRAAQGLFTKLEASGIAIEPKTGPGHLEAWLDSIEGFRLEAGV